MAQQSQIPKFPTGNMEDGQSVSYTQYFDDVRKKRSGTRKVSNRNDLNEQGLEASAQVAASPVNSASNHPAANSTKPATRIKGNFRRTETPPVRNGVAAVRKSQTNPMDADEHSRSRRNNCYGGSCAANTTRPAASRRRRIPIYTTPDNIDVATMPPFPESDTGENYTGIFKKVAESRNGRYKPSAAPKEEKQLVLQSCQLKGCGCLSWLRW